jgi:hypothetical protein
VANQVIYKFKGKLNHIVAQIHMTNLLTIEAKTIVLDFSDIILYDFEFLDEYQNLIETVQLKKNLKVKGFPIEWTKSIKWVDKMIQQNRQVF